MSEATNKQFERRFTGEIRVDAVDDRKIRGLAIAFNKKSVDLGGFIEYIAPEAVDRTLRDALDVRALVDHDSSKIVGRTVSGTLTLRKTRAGLEVVVDPPNTSYARDIIESVSRGDVTGMSFGFRVMPDGQEWDFDNETPVRTITDMVISEVSIVTFPAYPDTDVAVRALRAEQQTRGGTMLDFKRKQLRTWMAR